MGIKIFMGALANNPFFDILLNMWTVKLKRNFFRFFREKMLMMIMILRNSIL